METMLLFIVIVTSVSFLATYFGEGIFGFFSNLIGCLISMALTLLAVGTAVAAVAIVLYTVS